MAESLISHQLNGLLINLRRSFLQYVGEAWPWTAVDAEQERETIHRMVASQQDGIRRLTELLVSRNGYLDLGAFPTEYTDLHYIALDYLLILLAENERSLIDDIEAARNSLGSDPEALALLEHLLEDERDRLEQLQELADSRRSKSPAQ